MNVKSLVFSKDRPMQLWSYLKSLLCLTSIRESEISVIHPFSDEYQSLHYTFPLINWIIENEYGGFDASLRHYANDLDDNDIMLYGCDDVVWIRPCTMNVVPQVLKDPAVLGFSYRLGINTKDLPQNKGDNAIFVWDWTQSKHHFYYCFDLMASCYRGSLLKEILNQNENIKTPNFLESYGVNYCFKNKRNEQPLMAMFNTNNYAVAFDVNRVQHEFANKINGTIEQDAETLKNDFNHNKRIDWRKAFNSIDPEPFVGTRYWQII